MKPCLLLTLTLTLLVFVFLLMWNVHTCWLLMNKVSMTYLVHQPVHTFIYPTNPSQPCKEKPLWDKYVNTKKLVTLYYPCIMCIQFFRNKGFICSLQSSPVYAVSEICCNTLLIDFRWENKRCFTSNFF